MDMSFSSVAVSLAMATLIVLSTSCAGVRTGVLRAAPKRITWSNMSKKQPYPLDDESRRIIKNRCPKVQLVTYKGAVLPYHRPIKVNPFFRERLHLFEEVVRDVSMDVYGRPVTSIRHVGAYNCRRVAGTKRMSEHGLGNAIDVTGFEFDADPKYSGSKGRAFRVVLKKHWWATRGVERLHATFLHRLAEALSARPDIFRGMLGPGAAGHEDHFHLDVGRSRYMTMKR